jgi:hypothetical protein
VYYQCGEGSKACAQREQLSAYCLTCRLQIRCPLAARDLAYVMRGDQVSKWPDDRTDKHKADDYTHDEDSHTKAPPPCGTGSYATGSQHHGTTVLV